MGRAAGLMKEFVEKRGPPLSELIRVRTAEEVDGSSGTII